MKIRAVLILAVLAAPGLVPETGAATLDAWGAAALEQSPGWYSSDEAREVADKVLAYQSNVGAVRMPTASTMPSSLTIRVPARSGRAFTKSAAIARSFSVATGC